MVSAIEQIYERDHDVYDSRKSDDHINPLAYSCKKGGIFLLNYFDTNSNML